MHHTVEEKGDQGKKNTSLMALTWLKVDGKIHLKQLKPKSGNEGIKIYASLHFLSNLALF